MKVVLLGSAAGGGFPQWNCSCLCCSTARATPELAVPRTQSSVAIGTDDGRWFLVNVSPDVHQQLERSGLGMPVEDERGSSIETALITNADLDHCLGLFSLREDRALRIVCRPPVRRALSDGLRLEAVLARYCGVQWINPMFIGRPLFDRNDKPTGLRVTAIPAGGGPPKYFPHGRSSLADDSVGFRIEDTSTGSAVVILPDVESWSDAIEGACSGAALVLFDGTFWLEDELALVRPGAPLASEMGHLPICGPEGSLERLSGLVGPEKVYIHINNTNSILLEESDERRQVEKCGVSVGRDGMMWEL